MCHYVTSKELTQWYLPSLLILDFVVCISPERYICPNCAIRIQYQIQTWTSLSQYIFLLWEYGFEKKKKRVWHFWSENVLGRSQRNFKNRVIPSPVALSLPLRLAELSWRLNSPSSSDLHSASQRRICWKGHRDTTLQLQTPAFRSWHWAALSFNQRIQSRGRGYQAMTNPS